MAKKPIESALNLKTTVLLLLSFSPLYPLPVSLVKPSLHAFTPPHACNVPMVNVPIACGRANSDSCLRAGLSWQGRGVCRSAYNPCWDEMELLGPWDSTDTDLGGVSTRLCHGTEQDFHEKEILLLCFQHFHKSVSTTFKSMQVQITTDHRACSVYRFQQFKIVFYTYIPHLNLHLYPSKICNI